MMTADEKIAALESRIEYLEKTIRSLQSLARGPKGEDGRDGKPGKNGLDGKSVAMDRIRAEIMIAVRSLEGSGISLSVPAKPFSWQFETVAGKTIARPLDEPA